MLMANGSYCVHSGKLYILFTSTYFLVQNTHSNDTLYDDDIKQIVFAYILVVYLCNVRFKKRSEVRSSVGNGKAGTYIILYKI